MYVSVDVGVDVYIYAEVRPCIDVYLHAELKVGIYKGKCIQWVEVRV